jgi:hypothetical protein
LGVFHRTDSGNLQHIGMLPSAPPQSGQSRNLTILNAAVYWALVARDPIRASLRFTLV